MPEFVKVAKVSEVPAGQKLLVEADDRLVILFHVEGNFYCIDDVCTHDGGTLSDGPLVGCEIACPRHGARFDVRTGEAMCMPATKPTATHEVRVDGDDILVKINE